MPSSGPLSGYLFTCKILRASFCIIAVSAGELSERALIAADRSLRIELIERREENSSLQRGRIHKNRRGRNKRELLY